MGEEEIERAQTVKMKSATQVVSRFQLCRAESLRGSGSWRRRLTRSNPNGRGRSRSPSLVFASSSSSTSSSTSLVRVDAFAGLERTITERARESGWIPEESGWEYVEGCWVLPPKPEEPKALVHFIGGAFVGASPQITYRYFLEQLASKGFFVVATTFEHLKIADDIHLKFTQCAKALGSRVEGLQTVGVGHSMGALQQLLMCSRYK